MSWGLLRLRRDVHAEADRQADGRRCVFVESLDAAEAAVLLQRADLLHENSTSVRFDSPARGAVELNAGTPPFSRRFQK